MKRTEESSQPTKNRKRRSHTGSLRFELNVTNNIDNFRHSDQQSTSNHSTGNHDIINDVIISLLSRTETREDSDHLQLRQSLLLLHEKRKELGCDDFQVASALNVVGSILFKQHDFENALIFFYEELRIEKTVLECEDFNLSVTNNNIGRIYQEMQSLSDAIPHYYQSVKYCQLPNEDCSLSDMTESSIKSVTLSSSVWYNLGIIYDQLGSKRDAIFAFQLCLRLRKLLMGSTHAEVACLLFNIGVLQMELNMLHEATSSIVGFLQIFRVVTIDSLKDQEIVVVLQRLAFSHKRSNSRGVDTNLQTSLRLFREILNIQLNSTDLDPIQKKINMGSTLRDLAEVQCDLGQLIAATLTVNESVNILRSIARTYNDAVVSDYLYFELVSSLLFLGSILHRRCEPIVARSIFQEANTLMDAVASSNEMSSTSFPLFCLREIGVMLADSVCAAEA